LSIYLDKNSKKTIKKLSEFEKQVLSATIKIPFGKTRTYKWVAKKIGYPDAYRAVGNALKKNPYPILIPCHRVIRSDGRVGGYIFGERVKKYFIDLEKKIKSAIINKRKK
jgi:O-6-methylguanine DNA methyltransferase